MESLPRTPKVERVAQVRGDTRDQARLDDVDRIEGGCGQGRLHGGIVDRMPAGFGRKLRGPSRLYAESSHDMLTVASV